jgi:hypothetical protein
MTPTVSLAGEPVPARPRPGTVAAASPSREFQLVARGHAERAGLERFIADRYACTYGACVSHFAEHLVGYRNERGQWVAALGYTRAGRTPLFAEQYLDVPVEEAIAARAGLRVRRGEIVEVGNLAATSAGAARRVILSMTRWLHELACAWVVFTSTRLLLNSFGRLNIDMIGLAEAAPSRLPDGGASWGRYYETHPHVMAANIPLHFARLCRRDAGGAGARH